MPHLSIRTIGILAAAIPFWFLLCYLGMSTVRADYSHFTKAISELGSLDAPNGWMWNVGGYMIPGGVVALLGWGVGNRLRGQKGIGVSSYALIASGLLMLLSGVFPGDFENRTSFTMIMHAIGSFGGFLGFLVSGLTLPWVLRRIPVWRSYAWPSLALVLLSIVTGFLRSGNAPGIGQRLGFACFFAWVGLIGFALARSGGQTEGDHITR